MQRMLHLDYILPLNLALIHTNNILQPFQKKEVYYFIPSSESADTRSKLSLEPRT